MPTSPKLMRERGHEVLLIDAGSLDPPSIVPDVSREELVAATGADLAASVHRRDRGEAVKVMSEGAAIVIAKLAAEKKIQGIISLGGGGGTAIGTSAMRALPVGFPKLMVSTLAASENVPTYVGVKDIVMMPSVVDVAGLNRISRPIFTNAAGAICGMVETQVSSSDDKPIIAASMFGNTTECVNHAKNILEESGYEVLRLPRHGNWRARHGELDRVGTSIGCARPHHHRVGRRTCRRHSWFRAYSFGGGGKKRRACRDSSGMSRHGEFWSTCYHPGKILRTSLLRAQSTSHTHANDS